jgi:predicted nuclease of predicted toxin-antitoxin system
VRLLVDMNLSPDSCEVLISQGWQATHWSSVGELGAPDEAILAWARANDYIVFTHDLDFGTLLALTHADGPSVVQVRTQDVLPEHLGDIVIATLRAFADQLASGALLVIDDERSRVRLLPIRH